MGCVYELRLPDDSVYVGKTVQPFQRRMTQHKHAIANRTDINPIYSVIQKCGWENVSKNVLYDDEDANDEEILSLLEEEFIASYRLTSSKVFNIQSGGSQGYSWSFTEEQTEKAIQSWNSNSRRELARKAAKERWRNGSFAKSTLMQKSGLGHSRKLEEAQVIEIISLLEQKVPQRKIAKIYGVKQGTISLINRSETWSYLPRPSKSDKV